MSVRVRIAPSPTGDPHVGTAYIGLINYCFAKKNGGQFILRIEDTDQSRCTEASAQAIYESMRWLGLMYDEGPDVGGGKGPYVQSERVKLGIYRKYADQLLEAGHAYHCFCTARELDAMKARQRAANEPIMYDRRHRGLPLDEARKRVAAGEPYVIRMKVPLEGEHVYKDRLRKQPVVKAWKEIDDQVLLKSDGWPTYHLAAVVDDHLMGITHVIRAEEWLNSLPKHILLNEQLGFPKPEYVHVGLLRNADKSKISKRKNPTNLLWYREQGYLPEALLNFLATLGHSMPDGREKFSLDDLIASFDLDRINVAGPVFDLAKLKHLQGQYFRELPADRVQAEIHRAVDARVAKLLPLMRERMVVGGDFIWQAEPFYAESVSPHVDDLIPKGWTKEQARAVFEDVQRALKTYAANEEATWDAPSLDAFIRGLLAERANPAENAPPAAKELARLWQPKQVFMALRVAVTGKRESPPLFDTLAALGHTRVLERLGAAQQKLR
ncbi:MAG TPA: glutamate--tRNA ligase [Planctomycetota bacterium]|nr:glutamate--tRNA ligase [Planctomycetota bacterium]